MQASYDLAIEGEAKKADLETIERLETAA
jgi:hypothetical protein